MIFYLGTHRPHWLAMAERANIPLFVSRRQIEHVRYRHLPRSTARWALDSGGFTEVSRHGGWDRLTPRQYLRLVRRYADEIGMLDWAAPMDWMCEPFVLAKTGKTVREHQRLTVENYLELRSIAPELPIVPVLQGYELGEYLECVEMYLRAGVNLVDEKTVGVGSVCRRQSANEAAGIFSALSGLGLQLHGFGVKSDGFKLYGAKLSSADSMAWSYNAMKNPMMDGCEHAYGNCANCFLFAQAWYERALARA